MAGKWITTKGGDTGETSLCDGTRVPKDSLVVELYGTLDECQAHIGMARATCSYPEICEELCRFEQVMGPVMGYIARCETLPSPDISYLEGIIEKVRNITGETFRFVRPGDSVPGASLHVARTVARRAERVAVKLFRNNELDERSYAYINRLSDALYALSLWIDHEYRSGGDSSCK